MLITWNGIDINVWLIRYNNDAAEKLSLSFDGNVEISNFLSWEIVFFSSKS